MSKISLAICLLFCISTFCYALETDTHEALNENIAQNALNGFSIDSYLKNQLGIIGGIEESFNNNTALWWVKKGGLYEDVPYWYLPYLRSANHFHNPLTKAGFSGIWGTGFISGVSSLYWAQFPVGKQIPGGFYSWNDARLYFYKALTANDKPTKDQKFAATFRGIGQVMHLVQDLSVPEHTRDDGHYISYNYEIWAKKHINANTIPNYLPIYLDKSTLGNSNYLALIPIANLFDTNQYNGTNPTVTLQNNVGLSEYTNANFFSGGTIFKNGFPYPALSSVIETEETDSSGDTKTYLRKIADGEAINHLAVGKRYYKYLPVGMKSMAVRLDDVCYQEYAQHLIPRAIGYSAQLLNYFFRGELGVHQVIPVFKDNVLTEISVKVRNYTSTKETMSSGFFGLLYQYTNSNGELVSGTIPYVVSMADEGVPELPYGKNDDGTDKTDVADLEITFDSFSDNINITDYPSVKFTVAYFGDLGAEIRDKSGDSGNSVIIGGAVIGKVFKAGDVLFSEDWDTAPAGSYKWCHNFNAPLNSSEYIKYGVTGVELIKDIIDPYCTGTDSDIYWNNETVLSILSYNWDNYKADCNLDHKLPITITKDTYLEFKIDALTSAAASTAHRMELALTFNSCSNTNGIKLLLTPQDQPVGSDANTANFTFTLGTHTYGNIYDMFKEAGITIEPTTLECMNIALYGRCNQHMEMDYIRIIDAKPKDPTSN